MVRKFTRVSRSFDGPSKTKQSEAAGCDLNLLLGRMKKTGMDPYADRKALATYMDCSNIPSFQEAYDIMVRAEDLFASLPSEIRLKYDNDYVAFADSVSKTSDEELVKLGILQPAKQTAQPAVETPPAKPTAPEENQPAVESGKTAADPKA